jgi:hypothetical protein
MTVHFGNVYLGFQTASIVKIERADHAGYVRIYLESTQ